VDGSANALSEFAASLRIQFRVIGALLMREVITRYGRANLGALWLFVEPMMFTLGVLGLWVISGLNKGHDLPIAAFAVTGYSSVLLWRNCVNRASTGIKPNLGLLYHRNVRLLDVFLSRVLLEIGGATISFIVLTCLFVFIGLSNWPVDLGDVVLGWVLLGWFGGSLAILLGAASAFSDLVERFWHPAAYLVFPLAGALFMVDWLPTNFQAVILYLPMVDAIEILRGGYFGPAVTVHYWMDYLVSFCAIQTLLALAMVKQAEKRVEVL